MNLWIIAGIIIFLSSVILSQKISVAAASKLDDATKLKLVEIFPKRNINYTIVVFTIVIVFLVALYLLPQYFRIIAVAYAVTFALYIFMKLFLNARRLKEIGAPPEYIRSIVTSFGVFIGGALAAGIVIAAGN